MCAAVKAQWHLWAYSRALLNDKAFAGASSAAPSFGQAGPAASAAPTALSTFQFPNAPSSAPASIGTAGSTLGASLFPQAVSTPLPAATAPTSTPLSFGIATAAGSRTPAAGPASSGAANVPVAHLQAFKPGSSETQAAAPSAPPPGDVCKLLSLLLCIAADGHSLCCP